ncbi:hypothetical protein SK803_15170 [Lentzea sp. BCCO 10_0856]|uniref:DoxX-like family protein n=1 Tax=Lentzea miocenica TaxID=3095431 RepID=A0ABU4T070_9PSEU|nr:hypothetical protein [Lentzea sp. BCCO 10_0856]MDX8031566.1 hypothetical protein [Lentzea sp. BCCO 10_0856]
MIPARLAAGLSWLSGLGFGLPALYGIAYFARTGDVWQFMGFPTYGHGPFEKIGIPTTVPLLVGFGAVCGAEVIAGSLLWRGRRSGKKLALALLPFEVAYWIGFALPLGPLLGAGRTVAVICFRSNEPSRTT